MKRTVAHAVLLVAVAMAAIGVTSVPSRAASEKQVGVSPFVRAARSAERVEWWGLNGSGNSLLHNIELYMWKDIYMMGKVAFVHEFTGAGGDWYLIRVLTRGLSPDWDGGVVTLLYWDPPLLFSVTEGDIVEFVATAIGLDALPGGGEFPMLRVEEFQEMAYPGVTEGNE